MTLRYLSLFSGVGGFDLGFDRAGMVCAGQVEYDEKARAVLSRHWPDVKRLNDVKEVQGDEFGAIDLICGGFPCQDVSVAGRREGLAGERSGLWFEFHRIIERVRPRWVVVENVPGLLSSNAGRDFAVIISGLVKCGYGVAWRVLDAQYFGVPQRRRRVFIVGHLGDGRAAEVLFEREGGGRDIAEGRSKGAGIARPTQGNALAFGGNNTSGPIDIATAQNAHGGSGRLDFESETFVVASHPISPALTNEGHDSSEDGRGRHAFVIAFQPGNLTRRAGAPPSMSAYPTLGADTQGDMAPHVMALQMNFIRRARIGDKVGTLAAQPGDAQFNGLWDMQHGVRRLTPVECERLQGFPDGHTDGQSDSARYRQMGNAVAVPVAEWIGRRIVEVNA